MRIAGSFTESGRKRTKHGAVATVVVLSMVMAVTTVLTPGIGTSM
jgi:hypothetical protein